MLNGARQITRSEKDSMTLELIEKLKEQRDLDASEHCPAEIIALQDETISAIEELQAKYMKSV